jgi:hypothetical protein
MNLCKTGYKTGGVKSWISDSKQILRGPEDE